MGALKRPPEFQGVATPFSQLHGTPAATRIVQLALADFFYRRHSLRCQRNKNRTMSESAKAAQTLVWRASGGDAYKTHPICDSPGRRNSTLLAEKEVSCCSRSLGYQG